MKKVLVPIIVFVAALWIPILQMNLHFYKEFDNLENREMARPPDLKLSNIKKWASEFDAYLSDNFGMRPDLIRWNCLLRATLLGVSPVESVILGKQSWLFYRSEFLQDGDTVNDYMGGLPLSGEDLKELKEILEKNQKEFSRSGIAYLVAIAPNKNTVYGEYLPDAIEKFRATTRMDQFMAYMKTHSNLEILDLRGPLIQAKANHPTYLKTDSHWNSYGAYVGFREIMHALKERFPRIGLAAASIAGDEVAVETKLPGGDLSQMLFMQDRLPEENQTEFNLAGRSGTPLLNTLVFRHDSFGDELYQYLTPIFKNIVGLPPFVPFDYDAIRKQHPDAVIHVFVERYLPQAVTGDFYFKFGNSKAVSH